MNEPVVKVKRLELETLPPAPPTSTSTDLPVPEDARRTFAAILARRLRKLKK